MKTFKTTLTKSILLCVMVPLAFSCSEDEDEMDTPPEVADISYQVQVTKIKATDTSGEGDANNVELEIFGELTTALTIGTTVDTRTLWSVEIADAISVGQNDSQLTGEATFTIKEDKLGESSITCAGDLEENDGGGNVQNQGEESSTFTLASISGTQDIELTFTETRGQTVVVTFTVTRL